MRRSELQKGDRVLYTNGQSIRPVEIIDTHAVLGSLAKPAAQHPHPQYIRARFLDTNEVGLVTPRGCRITEYTEKKAPAPAPAPAKIPEKKAQVEVTFSLSFTVPAEKAGIIDTVMALLGAEGRVALDSVATASHTENR